MSLTKAQTISSGDIICNFIISYTCMHNTGNNIIIMGVIDSCVYILSLSI